jgi:hypothetical protein
MSPPARDDAVLNALTPEAGCGKSQRGQVHFVTGATDINVFKWFIGTAYPLSMCSIEISKTTDMNFQVVLPLNDDLETYGNGILRPTALGL